MSPAQSIPKIIHQTWKTDDVPPEWHSLQQTWKRHHPDWTHRFWTDETNRTFISQHYDWFLPTYDAYDQTIKRADAIRYFLMYHHGGLYVDLDFECLRPFETLLANKEVVLGFEPPPHADPYTEKWGFTQLICNALIASKPFHPFWKHVIDNLESASQYSSPIEATGPVFLTHAYHTYLNKSELSTIPDELLYPVTNIEARQDKFNPHKLHQRAGSKAYAIHYWYGSWWRGMLLAEARSRLLQKRTSTSK